MFEFDVLLDRTKMKCGTKYFQFAIDSLASSQRVKRLAGQFVVLLLRPLLLYDSGFCLVPPPSSDRPLYLYLLLLLLEVTKEASASFLRIVLLSMARLFLLEEVLWPEVTCIRSTSFPVNIVGFAATEVDSFNMRGVCSNFHNSLD